MRIVPLLVVTGLLGVAKAAPVEWEFVSGAKNVPLLELFTSEGCSSCPPAEEWFSQLKSSPALWKEIVPVAFHVDYWNSLGWNDPYSSAEWSARQREYSRLWQANSIYTPGFVFNGREWRVGASISSAGSPGELKLRLRKNGSIDTRYSPNEKSSGEYLLNVAPMACGVTQAVPRGENAGKTLCHDFVALTLLQCPLEADSNGQCSAHLVIPPGILSRTDAIASWVTPRNNQSPIQAAGGWLK